LPFLVYLPDGQTLLQIGEARIRFLDPVTGEERRPALLVPGLPHDPYPIANLGNTILSSDGKRFAAFMGEGVIGVWDVETGQSIGPAGILGKVGGLTFSSDGQTLATMIMARGGQIQLWDAGTGRPGHKLDLQSLDDQLRFVPAAPVLHYADARHLEAVHVHFG